MERVENVGKYYFINNLFEVESDYDCRFDTDNIRFDTDNYFTIEEQAEDMARKIRAVLKGADVIEMPSEDEILKAARERTERHSIAEVELHKGLGKLYGYSRIENAETVSFKAGVEYLKSKIIK